MVFLVHAIYTIMKTSIDDEPQPTIGTIPKADEFLDVVEKMTDPTACNGFSMAVQYEDVTVGKSVAIKLLCLYLAARRTGDVIPVWYNRRASRLH